MPKFQKNTGYQMPHGNSPHKFLGKLLGGIFGGGKKSAPKPPTGLTSGSRYTGSTAASMPHLAGGLGNKKFGTMMGGKFVSGAIGMGQNYGNVSNLSNAQILSAVGNRQSSIGGTARSLANRFASGRRRRVSRFKGLIS